MKTTPSQAQLPAVTAVQSIPIRKQQRLPTTKVPSAAVTSKNQRPISKRGRTLSLSQVVLKQTKGSRSKDWLKLQRILNESTSAGTCTVQQSPKTPGAQKSTNKLQALKQIDFLRRQRRSLSLATLLNKEKASKQVQVFKLSAESLQSHQWG